jgi:hypothetical protein
VNVASVSWGDHLAFGEGDGRLATPDAVARRLVRWRRELGAGALHWRVLRTRLPGRFQAARGYRHPSQSSAATLAWDDLATVPGLAHAAGLDAWLYVSVFDEGWPLAPPAVRRVSHHNAMHGRDVAWQSDLTRAHPHWLAVDRSGRKRQWGVVSLAYPAARRAFIARWRALLAGTRFDGLFLCLRSQSRPPAHADAFGHNTPVCPRAAVDVAGWRAAQGRALTTLLEELRPVLASDGRRLGVGVARGDVLGPPLGNGTLEWRDWLRRRLVDQLVIDQNSSQCPSMWHRLWPMHRGAGYLQNYLDGSGLPPLLDHVRDAYAPAARAADVELVVARQWHPRDRRVERRLLGVPGVSGLALSTFRHDNPAAVARNDWRAGKLA